MQQSRGELRKPVLNVERLEPISTSEFTSEADEEDPSRGFRGLNAHQGLEKEGKLIYYGMEIHFKIVLVEKMVFSPKGL